MHRLNGLKNSIKSFGPERLVSFSTLTVNSVQKQTIYCLEMKPSVRWNFYLQLGQWHCTNIGQSVLEGSDSKIPTHSLILSSSKFFPLRHTCPKETIIALRSVVNYIITISIGRQDFIPLLEMPFIAKILSWPKMSEFSRLLLKSTGSFHSKLRLQDWFCVLSWQLRIENKGEFWL